MCDTTERAELLLPMDPGAPRAARAFARANGCSEHVVVALDEALVLISELVTNAVRYGSPPLALALECEDGGLRVRVRDGGPALLPQAHRAAADAERGRGLDLVDQLSTAWGVESVADEHGEGKAVWFELRPPDVPAA